MCWERYANCNVFSFSGWVSILLGSHFIWPDICWPLHCSFRVKVTYCDPLSHKTSILSVSCDACMWSYSSIIVLTWLVVQVDKHESVLSMALEHGLVGFILACISQWSTAGDGFSDFITITVYKWSLFWTHCVIYGACCVLQASKIVCVKMTSINIGWHQHQSFDNNSLWLCCQHHLVGQLNVRLVGFWNLIRTLFGA